MKKKIALKRLSSSDLTLFEYHYRNTSGAKQKAINLDASVFIGTMFPGLPSKMDAIKDRVIITLSIYGPGGVGAHSITRKILKQQKNWRLNGELISNPPEEGSRYNTLTKGDYAIFDFAGEPEPHTARMYLIARELPQDAALHTALEDNYGKIFTGHKGMLEIDADDLARLLSSITIQERHPILDFFDSDALEDAAQGGLEGVIKLRRRRQNRGVSREELARARQSAEHIGRLGEEILNAWLEERSHGKTGAEHRWNADTNAVAPYDFTLMNNGQEIRRIDAKSTAGDFSNTVHVSMAELIEMAEGELPYDLYRLYSISQNSARLRIAGDMKPFAAEILGKLDGLPQGVRIDGISIAPDTLKFEDEITIDLADQNSYSNEE